ncbi:sporulation integral membrane protein YtvI [Sporosalibacterium faouarense]|uniref:sporulation integral membrane protein YtvI n=1 Tax=Sporosalibacterium faouarense TaxID=516123 RepID=UPI00141D51AF|nr:sporulation integral membrane protein YtvI [Sporosalibacterium faouarense]MTI49662.1 sporulation integral membrane protein YtvI [Bacillota bacterium]
MDVPKSYVHFFLKIISVLIIFLLVYIFLTTVFKWLLPFILAYIIAYITNPLVNFMELKLRIPRRLASLIIILFTLLFIALVVLIVFYRIIFEIKKLSDMLPFILDQISNLFNQMFTKGVNIYDKLPTEFSHITNSLLDGGLSSISSVIATLTESTTKFAYGIAKSLPSLFIFIIVLFLSTYFISSDRNKISNYIFKQVPGEVLSNMVIVKNDLVFALFGYVKAQLILMSITFIEITIGMLLIGVDYPVLIALFISIIDALPILGTGIILLPWAFFALLSGDFTMALFLAILYIIVLLVRQMLEPKIIGKQIGLYPLVTLMSMYIGLKVFGIIGLIFGPISILIIKSLLNSNLSTLWKE